MKRHPWSLTAAAVVLLLGAAAVPLPAQRPPDRMPFQVDLNLGYVNLFAYPKWISLGAELEARLGSVFSINPDVSLWIGESFTRKVRVVPGLTGNIRVSRFLLGGGVVHRIQEWPDNPANPMSHGWLMPKAQIGYSAGPARLILVLYFPGGMHSVAAGLTISMGMLRPSRD